MVTSFDQIRRIDEVLRAVKNKETGPFEAFLQIKATIQPEEASLRIKRRFQFWTFELKSLQVQALAPKERLLFLRNYFFVEKAKLLRCSVAPEILLGLAMQNVAQITGLNLSFVLLGHHLALKGEVDGECQYISLDEDGRILDTQEVLDAIFDFGKIRRLDFSDLILAYFEVVQKQLDPRRAAGQLLRIYDLILTLRDADPKTLLRRAYLYKELGNFSEALADLKRYLNFQPNEPLTKSLKKFYSQLNSH